MSPKLNISISAVLNFVNRILRIWLCAVSSFFNIKCLENHGYQFRLVEAELGETICFGQFAKINTLTPQVVHKDFSQNFSHVQLEFLILIPNTVILAEQAKIPYFILIWEMRGFLFFIFIFYSLSWFSTNMSFIKAESAWFFSGFVFHLKVRLLSPLGL